MDNTIEIKKEFRDYDNTNSLVAQTYKLNHTKQTVEYVKQMLDIYCKHFYSRKMNIWDAIFKLDKIVDESDPDMNLSQMNHAFQTAEGMKKLYPDNEELHLIALLHDLGKVLLLPEFGNLPQWSVVGDTYPVGCKFSDKIVFSEFFKYNSDFNDFQYNTQYGIYKPNCGLDNVLFSFSHDEYFYQFCKHNDCLISDNYLKVIRYHSAYVIHKENDYEYLMNKDDYIIRDLCKQFSTLDLYTKDNNNKLIIKDLFPYYDNLIKKYFPNLIFKW